MDITVLVDSLDGYIQTAETVKRDDVLWIRRLDKIMETVPDSFDIDWTAVKEGIPETVSVDTDAADAIAKTITVLASDDDDVAKETVERWESVRPANRGRSSNGTRESKETDNPVWTCITVSDSSGRELQRHSRNPGAISSLYYPVWEYLRDNTELTKRDWDPLRKEIKNAVYSGREGIFTVGTDPVYTVAVSF